MEQLHLLVKIINGVRHDLRRLRDKVENEINYKLGINILDGENREILFDTFQKYTDALEMSDMFLRGDLSLGELVDELNRFHLDRFAEKMGIFKPDTILKSAHHTSSER